MRKRLCVHEERFLTLICFSVPNSPLDSVWAIKTDWNQDQLAVLHDVRSIVFLDSFPFFPSLLCGCYFGERGGEKICLCWVLGFFWEREDWRGGEWRPKERKLFFCHGGICCKQLRAITAFCPQREVSGDGSRVETGRVCITFSRMMQRLVGVDENGKEEERQQGCYLAKTHKKDPPYTGLN